ncbi:MAG: oligosaccharide flippase family protein [Pseudomonadota bacterium]
MTSNRPENSDDDLSRSVRSSMSWNLLEQGFSQIVVVVVFIFLTYKLEPAVFGIFALAVICIDYFGIQGKGAAIDTLLRRQKFDQKNLDSAFWILLACYGVGGVICFVIGWLLALASGEDSLKYILPALCLTLIPSAIEVVPGALLYRARDFKGTAIRQVFGASLGAVAAIACAFSEYPEWTLVAQRLVQVTVAAAVMCLRAKWIPKRSFDREISASFFKDWTKVFLSQFIAVSLPRSIDLIVGLSLGATQLGVMRVASRLVSSIYGIIGASIGRLWVILVSETDKPELRSQIYGDLTHLTGMVFVPVFFGIFALSDEFVGFVLGDEYQGAASVLQILSVVGLISPLYYFRNAAFTAIGLLNKLLFFCVIDVVVASILCLVMIKLGFGLIGAVSSLIGVAILQSILTTPVLLKEMHSNASVLIHRLMPAYLAGGFMAAIVFLSKSAFAADLNLGVTLLLVLTGAMAFFGFLVCFYRRWLVDAVAVAVPSVKNHPRVKRLISSD